MNIDKCNCLPMLTNDNIIELCNDSSFIPEEEQCGQKSVYFYLGTDNEPMGRCATHVMHKYLTSK